MRDNISEAILKFVNTSSEPLETKEILDEVKGKIKSTTRTKLFYRLTNLRGEGAVKGKFVGPGKGVWIWWSVNFSDKKGVKK